MGDEGQNSGEPPNLIGPYRVLRQLGRGGQATVYLAQHVTLPRQVALKVLDAGYALNEHRFVRFDREAAITSKLDHKGICTVFETGQDRGIHWIAMRYIDGESLAAKIASARAGWSSDKTGFVTIASEDGQDDERRPTTQTDSQTSGPRTWAEITPVLQLFEDAARALHAAHAAGVIHRDVKPGNILVNKAGEPVIVDFGLAEEVDGDYSELTSMGDILGTPAYMSPEQLTAQQIKLDARTDIYSLGVSLYESLTLRRPFESPTRDGLCQAILTKSPLDPRRLNRALSEDVKVVLDTALEKDRDHRYQTALDFAEDIRRIHAREPILAKPAGPVLRLWRWSQRNPLLALSVIGLIVALAGGLTASLIFLGREHRALRNSEATRLTSQSKNALATDPALALLLAERAAALSPSLETNNALLESLRELREDKTWFGAAGFSTDADARTMALTTASGRVLLVDLEHGFGETDVTPEGFVCSKAVMSPQGDRVLMLAKGPGAVMWSSGSITPLVRAPGATIHEAHFSKDGERIVLCAGGDVQVWNTDSMKVVAEACCREIPEVCLNVNGDLVAVSPLGADLLILRTKDATTRPMSTDTRTYGRIHAALSAEGARIVTWHSHTGVSTLRDVGSSEVVEAYRPEAPVSAAAFAPDGHRFATGLRNGTTQLWNASEGTSLGSFTGNTDPILCLAFSADGKAAVTASADHTIRVFDVGSRECTSVLRGHFDTVNMVAAGVRADRVVSSAVDGTVRVWSPHVNRKMDTPTFAETHALLPALSPVERVVARGGVAGAPKIEPADRTEVLATVTAAYLEDTQRASYFNTFKYTRAVFSPDGLWVAGLDADGRLCLRNTRDPEPGRGLPGISGPIWFCGFSPDGRRLAVRSAGAIGRERCLVDVDLKRAPIWLDDPAGGHLIRVSPDGRFVATIEAQAGRPVVLRAETGDRLCMLEGAGERITTLAFGPDGTTVVAGGNSGGVYSWTVDAPNAPRFACRRHTGIIRSVAVNEAGTLAVSTADDRTARIWSLNAGVEVLTIRDAGSNIVNAVFSTDQKRVITLSDGGRTRGWPTAPNEEARRRKPRELTPDEVDRFGTRAIQ